MNPMQKDNDFFCVSELDANMRLDKLLASRFPEQSRSYFQNLIDQELVLVNGKKVKKREKPQLGDEIEIEFILTPELKVEAEAIPLDVVFEDSDILIINKPAGMVVHPAAGNWSGTFVNALLYYCKSLPLDGDTIRPGIVHRLDKDTSGLLVAAKTSVAHRKLVTAFSQRAVHKEYITICSGAPPMGLIDLPIGRHPTNRQQMTVLSSGGKTAKTFCYPILKMGLFSLVQCILETGRTHQIRTHLKHIGHPILGDSTYGNLTLNKRHGVQRQFLHAHRLAFKHPCSDEFMTFEAPLPTDMADFLKKCQVIDLSIPFRYIQVNT